ncbi:MAG: 30S ribosomal protein S1 [bacterium]|nr:30S ribosomal protein S1 [bacterium]
MSFNETNPENEQEQQPVTPPPAEESKPEPEPKPKWNPEEEPERVVETNPENEQEQQSVTPPPAEESKPEPEPKSKWNPEEEPERAVETNAENEQEQQPVTPPPAEESKPEPEPKPKWNPEEEPERVVHLSDLKEEVEYDQEESAFMSKLYEDTMQQILPGQIINGRIIAINDREVAIDIGFKSEGTVSIEEFAEPASLNIGDSIEVFLEDIENTDGQLVLSKKKADFTRVWERIMGLYERGEKVSGKCVRRIKGGIVVDVMGIDAFLPGSQIDVHPVRDFDSWIGQTNDFRIVKVNEIRKNIVISRKVLIEENLREVREEILGKIEIGQVIEGIVKNITDFGAFVDLGGVDGLLHITDLSWGRVNHPSEIVSYDQKLNVRILDFDPVRKRISVGLKQLQAHPWEGIEQRFPVTTKVQGKVVSITKYGAFVELEEGIEGLIHISEMSWTQHIKHPSQLLNIGQDVDVVVLAIDAENRKVSLGLKQTEEDPWEKLEQKYSVGSRHKGVVRDLVPFGAFVELEEGVEGLIHISDLSWTRKIRHPGEIVKKGDEIEVNVLSFDRNERRIALGHKQTQDNPWEHFEQQYPVGTLLEGSIARTVDRGAIVELPMGLEGFLPVSHFGKDPGTGRGRALKEGEAIRIEILDFDKESKKIVVSAAGAQKREDEADYESYLKAQKDATDAAPPVVEPEAAATEPEVAPPPKAKKPSKKAAEAKKSPVEAEAAPEMAPAETIEIAEAAPAETSAKAESAPPKKAPRKKKTAKSEDAEEKPEAGTADNTDTKEQE